MTEEDQARLTNLKRARKAIQRAQRRVVLSPHLGGYKKVPSTNKQFDWQFRLDEVNAEIELLKLHSR